MVPLFAAAVAASAWEGFAAGVSLGLAVYKATKSQDPLLYNMRKVGDTMYPFAGFVVALVLCELLKDEQYQEVFVWHYLQTLAKFMCVLRRNFVYCN